jgi:hypothetical protein
MRDYGNIPKLNWQDDKPTLAKIKAQVMREEPLILLMPDDLKFSIDAESCGCKPDSDMLLECRPQTVMATLARDNDIPSLNKIGDAIDVASLTIDVDIKGKRLIIH